MVSNINESKPVWKITGRLGATKGKKIAIFVNADSEEAAREIAKEHEPDFEMLEEVFEVDARTGLKKQYVEDQ